MRLPCVTDSSEHPLQAQRSKDTADSRGWRQRPLSKKIQIYVCKKSIKFEDLLH